MVVVNLDKLYVKCLPSCSELNKCQVNANCGQYCCHCELLTNLFKKIFKRAAEIHADQNMP